MNRTPFINLIGIVAPLRADNIDTDQIIPSREMKRVGRDGLSDGLFAGQRYLNPGSRAPNPEFALNKPEYKNVSILLSGTNFGCGSSREHAVWALAEYGVRCIIAESFGEIFYSNCGQNGILPIALAKCDIDILENFTQEDPQKNKLTVNLEKQSITAETESSLNLSFNTKAYQKRLLVGGLDPIGLTLERKDEIAEFITEDSRRRPWIYK